MTKDHKASTTVQGPTKDTEKKETKQAPTEKEDGKKMSFAAIRGSVRPFILKEAKKRALLKKLKAQKQTSAGRSRSPASIRGSVRTFILQEAKKEAKKKAKVSAKAKAMAWKQWCDHCASTPFAKKLDEIGRTHTGEEASRLRGEALREALAACRDDSLYC